jgi:hypothetical protein
MTLTKENSFYVYWYRNPIKDGEIFYVGYGDKLRKCGGVRAYDHLNEVKRGIVSSNKHKYYTILKIINRGQEPTIKIVKENLNKQNAQTLEKQLRIQYKNTLTNIANGGDGDTFTHQTTYKKNLIRKKLRIKSPTVHSEEWKRKLSKERTGKGNPFYGKKHSKKNKWKFGSYYRGKKISKSLIRKRITFIEYSVKSPTGKTILLNGRKRYDDYFQKLNKHRQKSKKINFQEMLKTSQNKGWSIIQKIEKHYIDKPFIL